MIVVNEKDALVIIDPQRDFVDRDGKLYVAGVDDSVFKYSDPSPGECIDNIIQLGMYHFGHVTITMDTHPEVHVEHTIYPEPHCVAGTSGTYVVDEIAHAFMSPKGVVTDHCAEIITKGEKANVIAYSVATSPMFDSHLYNLRTKGIKRVFVAGWAYDYCVGESAIAYKVQGFEAYVIRDATRSADTATAKEMDAKLEAYDVLLVRLENLQK